jgi:hypothetical protein
MNIKMLHFIKSLNQATRAVLWYTLNVNIIDGIANKKGIEKEYKRIIKLIEKTTEIEDIKYFLENPIKFTVPISKILNKRNNKV